jgi:hypothetical protein
VRRRRSPRPDLIFVSTRDGDYAAYAMNADGGRQKRLTKADVDTSSPAGIFFQTDPASSPNALTSRSRASVRDVRRSTSCGPTAPGQSRRVPTTSTRPGHHGKRLAFERTRRSTPWRRGERRRTSSPKELPTTVILRGRRIESGSLRPKAARSVEREIWIMRPDGSTRGV